MLHKLSIVAVLALGLLPATAIGQKELQTQVTPSQHSYLQARKVLDDALEAHGGVEALRSIKDFTLKEKGTTYARFQSATPDLPFSTGTTEETLIVDTDRGLVFDELKTVGGGFNNWTITVVKGTESQAFDMWSKTATPVVNPSINNFRPQMRRMPHVVVLEALDRASTLRWLGESELGGKKLKAVSVLRPDNQQLTLYFDAQTNLLSRYEYLYADPIVGDAVIAQSYPAYRTLGKVKVPNGRVLYNSGGAVQEIEYTDVQINTRPAENIFSGPAGFEKLAAPPATPPPPAVSKIADDVYVLNGLAGGTHNIMFVAFNDHVLVLEAPEQIIFGANSVQALAKIKETVPGKPIKYLVLTHHHSDHIGGFRDYIAEGATIVTTEGNKTFLEKVATTESTLLPKVKGKLLIETMTKKRIFQDDKHVVELYDIGPNPHAKEMIVAYLPKQKILFQADLFNPAANGSIPIAQDVTISFFDRLEQLGLDVEKIYGVHGRATTTQELKASVEKRRASELKTVSDQ